MVALSGVYLHAQFGPAKAARRSACSMSLLTDPGALNAGVEVSASIAVLKAKSGLETQSHCRHGACWLAGGYVITSDGQGHAAHPQEAVTGRRSVILSGPLGRLGVAPCRTLAAVLLRRRGKASQNQVHNRPDYVPVGDFVDTE